MDAVRIIDMGITIDELHDMASKARLRHPGERLELLGFSAHPRGKHRIMMHYNTGNGGSHCTTIEREEGHHEAPAMHG